jgi:hypothetical protein
VTGFGDPTGLCFRGLPDLRFRSRPIRWFPSAPLSSGPDQRPAPAIHSAQLRRSTRGHPLRPAPPTQLRPGPPTQLRPAPPTSSAQPRPSSPPSSAHPARPAAAIHSAQLRPSTPPTRGDPLIAAWANRHGTKPGAELARPSPGTRFRHVTIRRCSAAGGPGHAERAVRPDDGRRHRGNDRRHRGNDRRHGGTTRAIAPDSVPRRGAVGCTVDAPLGRSRETGMTEAGQSGGRFQGNRP